MQRVDIRGSYICFNHTAVLSRVADGRTWVNVARGLALGQTRINEISEIPGVNLERQPEAVVVAGRRVHEFVILLWWISHRCFVVE